MSLAVGTRLGPYEVLGSLGAGGMGEVYRAHDTRLNRDVAIKVLPAQFAADPERLARFEREAKTLASLNHPNIAQIFGSEPASSGHALVMELVDGEDLSARIARGPVPIEDAIAIARQMAEALEAAHEQGIIHRDLKPANIKVRDDGTVKVLDFGLAKAIEPDAYVGRDLSRASQPSALANSPTFASPVTQMGVILGTAAYMAPEQAKGRAVDRRADIWAFGVILLEMLTGRSTFKGENVTETLADVLTGPIDLHAIPRALPSSVQALLRRCLERDPRRRLRDIGEARVVLEAPGEGAPAGHEHASARATHRLPWMVAAAASLSAVGLAALMMGRPAATLAPVVRASIQLPAGAELAWAAANPTNISISRDGSTVAYAATALGRPASEASLYIRRLDAASSKPVPDSEGVNVSFFSPDGQWVGFFADGILKKAPVSGGAPVTVASLTGKNIWGATWLPDGTIVFSDPHTTGEMLYTVAASGGEPTLLSRVGRLDLDHSFPRFFGDGRLLVTRWTGGLYANGQIAAFSREKGDVSHVVIEGGSNAQVLSSGHLVYARGSELLAAAFDARSATLRGTPVSLLDGMVTDARYGTPMFDISPTGALVYAPQAGGQATPVLQWIERSGKAETVLEERQIDVSQARSSADGRHVVHQSISNNRDVDLWAYDTATGRRNRLTAAAGEEYNAVIMPGGTVLFAAWRGQWGMHRVSLAGGREDTLEFAPGTPNLQPWSVTADGRWLAVGGDNRDRADLGVIDLHRQPYAVKWIAESRFTEVQARFSPSGRHLAYESDQLGRSDVWVMTFSAGNVGAAVPVSREGGHSPFWSRDGRILYYTADSALMTVDVEPGEPVRTSAPRRVLDLKATTAFGVGEDGRFIAVRRERAPVTRLEIILNWTDEIRQRVR